MNTIEIILYSHFATALVNDDYSGLSEADIETVDTLVEVDIPNYTGCNLFSVVDVSEGFYGFPDLGGDKMGQVSTYIISHN